MRFFFFLFFVLPVTAFLIYTAFERYAKRLVGPIDFSISNPVMRMGEELMFSLKFSPRKKVTLKSVQVILRGYEWIQWTETEWETSSNSESGGGGSTSRTVTKTKTHELYRNRSDVAHSRVVQTGEAIEHHGSFRIPQEGPPSVTAPDNKIIWKLSVEIGIKGLPEIQEEHSLSVLPVKLQTSA